MEPPSLGRGGYATGSHLHPATSGKDADGPRWKPPPLLILRHYLTKKTWKVTTEPHHAESREPTFARLRHAFCGGCKCPQPQELDKNLSFLRLDQIYLGMAALHERRALVLYGSETGNAQDVAEEMGRIAERLRFDTDVLELNVVSLVRSIHIP